MSIDAKIRLILLIILAIGTILFGGILWLFLISPLITGCVLMALLILHVCLNLWKPKKRRWQRARKIMLAPYVYFEIALDFTSFFISVTSAYMFSFTYVVAPMIIIAGILKYLYPAIRISFLVFIILSVSSIFMANRTKFVKDKILMKSMYKVWSSEESKKDIVEIGLYMFQPKNIHFIILLMYVIFICVIAVKHLQYHMPLITDNVDEAIRMSFLVYLAYASMKQGYVETESDSKVVLAKLLNMCHLLPVIEKAVKGVEEAESPVKEGEE